MAASPGQVDHGLGSESALSRRSLLVVFAVAFAVQASYLLEMRSSPLFAVTMGDGVVYDAWARRIASGNGWGSPAYYPTPIYPWFLACVDSVVPTLEAARWVQAAIGAASCAMIASATASLFGRGTGLVAGVLLALYSPGIAYGGAIEKTVLDVFFVSALLALLASPTARSPARCFAVGCVIAVAAIGRETLYCAYAVIVPWTLANTRASRALSTAAFAAGTALVLSLVALQSWRVHGEFTPSRGQLGANFYIGNHAGADGLYVPLIAGDGSPVDEERDARRVAEAELDRTLTRAEVSDFWLGRAIAWIAEHPRDAASLFARKLRYTLHDTEWTDTHGYAAYREESRVLGGLGVLLRFGTLGALAVYGIAATWSLRRRWWPLAALAALLALATAAFFVFGRFRMVLVPMLAPFAAAALVDLAKRPRFDRTRFDRARVAGAFAASLFALSAFGPTQVEDDSVADTWINASGSLAARGLVIEADAFARRAVELEPARAGAHVRLAHVLACQRRWNEAECEARRAVELDPSCGVQAAFELGLAAGRNGDLERAAHWLRAVVAARPDHTRAWDRLGVALRGLGRTAEAERALRRAHASDPRDPDSLNDLGYLLERTGRIAEARTAYVAALAIDPDHPQASINRARVTRRNGARLDHDMFAERAGNAGR